MKNRFEDYCYVCGEVVEEEKGIAELHPRDPKAGGPGWGTTVWKVRHINCTPPEKTDSKATNK